MFSCFSDGHDNNNVMIFWFLGFVCRNWEKSNKTGPVSKIFPAILHYRKGNFTCPKRNINDLQLRKICIVTIGLLLQISRALLLEAGPIFPLVWVCTPCGSAFEDAQKYQTSAVIWGVSIWITHRPLKLTKSKIQHLGFLLKYASHRLTYLRI